jgi:hypothetical protein
VSLDPDNALVRSYLGKAYFEEKRDKQAGEQYEMSKQLDPRDPTPYFYDAIRKQTTNRPVEALQDMQKAIELNDNRAVYRSRLLLDSDLAARSAALGRIYGDLGFQQLALVEGWKSASADPTNFSAHRFLADSYSAVRRHEIARVSELLQSQLLQPLNMTPIQPRLAVSNLFLISAGGPAGLSFNEFNPIFNRNGMSFQSTGVAGENSTYGGEGVLAGIYNKFAFSLGGIHFQTDGFRKNADQRDFIGNGFAQFELSPETSVQAEIRHRETESGDFLLRFFPQNFFPGQRDRLDEFSARIGGRHAFSPNSVLLASFMFQDTSFRSDDKTPVDVFKLSLPRTSVGLEMEHLYRSGRFNLVSGFGYFDIDARFKTAVRPISVPDVSVDQGLRHFNAYSYANLNILKNLVITGGGTVDYLSGAAAAVPDETLTQFNPKFGVSWNVFPGTMLRAAIFRTVKRTLISDQTLEPTQVAGFNQFFDDVDVTKAWRYGIALDQEFSDRLFAGLSFAKRDLKVPGINPTVSPPATLKFDVKEYLSQVYTFWAPQPWLALRVGYEFERFKNNPIIGTGGTLDTHRVPLGINLFHSSGFGASLGATYYYQDGQVTNFNTVSLEPAKDNFWLFDAALNYRIPNRYGFLTLGAINMLDKKFKFFETDFNNIRIQPKRTIFFRVTIALP